MLVCTDHDFGNTLYFVGGIAALQMVLTALLTDNYDCDWLHAGVCNSVYKTSLHGSSDAQFTMTRRTFCLIFPFNCICISEELSTTMTTVDEPSFGSRALVGQKEPLQLLIN